MTHEMIEILQSADASIERHKAGAQAGRTTTWRQEADLAKACEYWRDMAGRLAAILAEMEAAEYQRGQDSMAVYEGPAKASEMQQAK